MTMSPQLALPVDVEDHGEVRVYRMVFPFLPPSKNVYDGWLPTWQSSAKKKWIRRVGMECEAQMVPTGLRRVGLSAALVFPSRNRRDPQNYASTLWNFVPDALQRCGVLLDDRDGAIDFGKGLGVSFRYDLREGVPKARRQRTVLSLAVLVR